MSNTKIILFGSTGMLGNYIKSYLLKNNKEILSIDRNILDISNVTYEKLNNLIIKYNIKEDDIIINCIGIIPQSENKNKTDNRNYFLINSLFPNMLGTISYIYKLKLIHITTDCVFTGEKGNYTELDLHDEINYYGVSKSLGELVYNATIIRTSIIGEENKNKYSLLEWVKKNKNKEINGYDNHYWNGVTCLQLAKIIKMIIEKELYWKGVRHIFSPKNLSKYELIKIINEIYNLNIKINKFKTKENINKTLDTIYDTNSLFNIHDLQLQINELKNYIF